MPTSAMATSWRRLVEGLVEAVYPPRCSGCGLRGVWVCDACLDAQPLFAAPLCERCGIPVDVRCRCAYVPASIERLRSAGPYNGWLREGVHRMKFQGEPARAPHLASLLSQHARSFVNANAIVPVPIHPRRYRERGFNQSELLAKEVGSATGLPVWPALLRVRDTAHQVDLTDEERAINVKGAFALAPGAPQRGVSIIVLDDVFTTGSTMGECARVLLDAGVERVYGLSLC